MLLSTCGWYFHNLNGISQHRLVTQWIRLKDKNNQKQPYQLPVCGLQNVPPTDALKTTYPIWRNALQSITQFGRDKFKTSTEAADNNVEPTDWRVEQNSNNALKQEIVTDDGACCSKSNSNLSGRNWHWVEGSRHRIEGAARTFHQARNVLSICLRQGTQDRAQGPQGEPEGF
jgi:hypothetical protein